MPYLSCTDTLTRRSSPAFSQACTSIRLFIFSPTYGRRANCTECDATKTIQSLTRVCVECDEPAQSACEQSNTHLLAIPDCLAETYARMKKCGIPFSYIITSTHTGLMHNVFMRCCLFSACLPWDSTLPLHTSREPSIEQGVNIIACTYIRLTRACTECDVMSLPRLRLRRLENMHSMLGAN